MPRIFTLFLLLATAYATAQPCKKFAVNYFPPILVKERIIQTKGKTGLELEKKGKGSGIFDFLPNSLKSWLELEYSEQVVSSEAMQKINGCSCGLYYKYHGKVQVAVKDAKDYASRMAIAGPYMSDYGEEFVSRCLSQTFEKKQPEPEPKGTIPVPPKAPSPRKPVQKPPRRQKPASDCNGSATVKLERNELLIYYPCSVSSGISGEYWISTCCPPYQNEMIQYLPPIEPNYWNRFTLKDLSIPEGTRYVRVEIYENPPSRFGERRLIGKMTLNFAR